MRAGQVGSEYLSGADGTTAQKSSPERNKEEATAITPYNGAEAPQAGLAKALGGDDARLSPMLRRISDLRDLFLSSRGNEQDGPRQARDKATSSQSGARAGAITSQPATVSNWRRSAAPSQG